MALRGFQHIKRSSTTISRGGDSSRFVFHYIRHNYEMLCVESQIQERPVWQFSEALNVLSAETNFRISAAPTPIPGIAKAAKNL